MQKLSLFGAFMIVAVLFSARPTRSDNSPPPPPPAQFPTGEPATPEPTIGPPAVNAPGDETPRHDPFTPYDIGPSVAPPGYVSNGQGPPLFNTSPTPFWSYDQLNTAEKAWADANRDTTRWDAINAGYAHATAQQAQAAAASANAAQLGVDNLGGVGVVP